MTPPRPLVKDSPAPFPAHEVGDLLQLMEAVRPATRRRTAAQRRSNSASAQALVC